MKQNVFVKVCDFIQDILFSLCKVLLILQVLITVYAVICRYIFTSSPAWGETAANMCFVWIGLTGAGLAVRHDLHMKITLTEHFLPKIAVKVLDIFASIAILLFAIFMITKGFSTVLLAAGNTLPGMNLKSSWLYLSVPVSGCMIVFSLAARVFNKKREQNNEH
jgi:TRAP-type C4-dicarboxylate transport system permease small subunit